MKRFFALALALPLLTLACGGGDGDGDGGSWRSFNQRLGAKYQSCGILSSGQFGPSAGFPDEGPSAGDRCQSDCIIAAPCQQLVEGICREEIGVELQTCLDDCDGLESEFTCVSGEKIPLEWECDGEDDCKDGTDEVGCPEPTFFECASGDESIPEFYECDGGEDCEDGSDEVGCPEPEVFACASGESIPAGFECSGEEECADGSDEVGCAEFICE